MGIPGMGDDGIAAPEVPPSRRGEGLQRLDVGPLSTPAPKSAVVQRGVVAATTVKAGETPRT